MAINTLFLSSLGLLFFFLGINLVRFLRRVWWYPIRVKKAMEAQGIRGPPYRFLHGNTKEVAEMLRESMSRHMGLSHDILPKILPHLHAWIKAYGRNFLKWHGPQPELGVSEPELIKEILTNRDGAYIKAPATSYVKKLIGDGLVTTEGKKWVRQRKLANHSFRAENLKGMIPDMVESVEGMLKKWEEQDGKEVNLFQEFTVLTSDVISRTAFGSSYIEGKIIFTKLQELATIAARNAQTIPFPVFSKLLRNGDEMKSDMVEEEMRESIIRLVRKREECNDMGEPNGYGSDFLGSLIKASHETDKDAKITLEDIIDECKTFYFAGHETTTGMLTWTAFLLAVNTDWQDKARKEVIESFGQTNYPTSDDTRIARLKTMTMIINESLRLYPPVLLIRRRVTREVRLGNLILPAGMEMSVSPLVLHHDPKLWGEDAHLFMPERFADGVAGATSNAMSFLPFGAGPRICLGQSFAMNEAKVAFSMILQRYSFTLSPGYVHSPVQHITNRPQHGLQVVIHKL